MHEHDGDAQPELTPQFNPLASKAATISLSGFGPGGPFSFDGFSNKWKKHSKKSSKKEQNSQVHYHCKLYALNYSVSRI